MAKEMMESHGLEVQQPGLETVQDPSSGLEVNYMQSSGQYTYVHDASLDGKEVLGASPRRICGLRRNTFLLSIALALVVILAIAIGTSVGLTTNSSKSDQQIQPFVSSVPSTSTFVPSSTASAPTSPSVIRPSAATASPISDCPGSNGTRVSAYNRTFLKLCDTDFPVGGAQNWAVIPLPTFDDCISLCASIDGSQFQAYIGAVYNVAGVGNQTPGSCWCAKPTVNGTISAPGKDLAVEVTT